VLIINNGDHKPLMINDLSGASRRYPLIALTFSLSLFALGAIPPIAGFMSEWQIFTAGFETKNIVITCLILFAAFNSVFSLAYYAPLVNVLYRRKPSTIVSSGTRLPLIMTVPLIALTAVLIIVGLWPSLMNWLTLPAGLDLLAAFVG
jgi:NADH:ubiquinone oxidoreductase subunit 2 (subunit N)